MNFQLTKQADSAASSIDCRDLSLQFKRGPKAVSNVDLMSPAGQILSLIGPSGCGKTSLLRLMAGLESPTSGAVVLEPSASSQQGELGFVFQQPALLPWRTALENVVLPLQLIGRAKTKQVDAASTWLAAVGLADSLHKLPHELSGGMKMRVSIARALVTEPRLLLLDEPFAALDDMLRNQLGDLLLDLWQQHRFTTVMVTHNIAEAILLSHHVAVMQHGSVVARIDNPLPWPRNESTRTTAEFADFYGHVSQSLRVDAGHQA